MTRQTQDFEDRFDEVITRYDEHLAESTLSDIIHSGSNIAVGQSAAEVIEDTVPTELASPDRSENHRLRRVLHCLDLLELARRSSECQPGQRQHGSFTATSPQDRSVDDSSTPQASEIVSTQFSNIGDAVLHRQISRFSILRKLGAGGFGIVFLAEDPVLRRKVAIKIPRLRTVSSPELQQRFVRESQLVARLTHPNVVPIYDAGHDGAISYQVTEYCSGGSLAAFLKEARTAATEAMPQRQLQVEIAADLLIGITDGVQHAHENGILHRDLKPANILLQPRTESLRDDERRSNPLAPDSLSRDYLVRVSDFGLAKLFAENFSKVDSEGEAQNNHRDLHEKTLAESIPNPSQSSPHRIDSRHTAMAGTPRYMAPEQLTSSTGAVGPATDVYALGAILYEVLCGVPAFEQTDPGSLRDAIQNEMPKPCVKFRNDVPRDLEAICFRALSKSPTHRYNTAALLAEDLRAFRRGDPVAARPWSLSEKCVKWSRKRPMVAALLATIGVLALGLIGFGFWHLGQLKQSNLRLNQTVQLLREQTTAADQSSRLALEKSRVALEQTRLAEEQRRSAERFSSLASEREYSAAILHAADLFRSGNQSQLSAVLQHFIPSSSQQPRDTDYRKDHRGFEWFYLWNQSRSEMDLRGHISSSRTSQVTPDGKQCLSLSVDGRLCRWDLSTGQLLESHSCGEHRNLLFSSFCADAGRVAVLSSDLDENEYMLSVLDTRSGAPLLEQSGQNVRAVNCILSPDGSTVLWNGLDRQTEQDGAVILEAFHVDSVRRLKIDTSEMVPGQVPIWLLNLAISPDNSTLFVHAHFAGGSRVFSTSIQEIVAAVSKYDPAGVFNPAWKPVTEIHPGIGRDIVCSPNGKLLAVGNRDPNTIRIIDVGTGHCLGTKSEFYDWSYLLSFEGNERLVIGHDAVAEVSPQLAKSDLATPGKTGPTKGVLTIWDLKTDNSTSVDADVSSLTWHEPSRLRIIGRRGGQVTAISEFRAVPFVALSGHHPREAWGVAFSSDGQRLFSVGDDSALRVWDVKSHSLINSYTEHTSLVSCIAVSPDGRWIATGSYDDTVNLWNADTMTVQHRLVGHSHDLRALAFSPDSSTLVSGGRCPEIRLWDVQTGTLRTAVRRYSSVIRGLAFLSQTDFVEGNASGQIVRHDGQSNVSVLVADRQEIHSLALLSRDETEVQFPEGLLSSDVTSPIPCNRALVFGGKFGAIEMLPIGTTKELMINPSGNSSLSADISSPQTIPVKQFYGVDIRSVIISPDKRSIAIAGDDRTVHILSVQTGAELLSFTNLPAAVNAMAFAPGGDHLAAALHNGDVRVWSTATPTD